MPLTSSISPPNPGWPQQYRDAEAQLAPIFGSELIAKHHVGSTAVAGLAAKPEIDILAVVTTSEDPQPWTDRLAELGFHRGGDLSPGHRFYKRELSGVRTHKLHVCVEGHPTVREMLTFRDHLRTNEADRRRYEELKLQLERENVTGISEYLAGKRPLITAILAQLGIERL